MVSFFDSFPGNHKPFKSVKSFDTLKAKTISTPIRQATCRDISSITTRRPTIPNVGDITLYTITKDLTIKNKTNSLAEEFLDVKKGELVQLISKIKDPKYVYVKKINSIGEGLVPVDILKEYDHLLFKPNNNNNNNNNNNVNSIKDSNHNISSIDNIPNNNSISHHHIMELTPPTSPLTITSNTFSIASLSRNQGTSPRSSFTPVKKLFDVESPIVFMDVESVSNQNERVMYILKITNQLNQECWKGLYYQDLYNLHLEIVTHPNYNNNELFLPKLPSPLTLTISKKETGEQANNIDGLSDMEIDRIKQINNYIQSMFKALSMESNTSILKHIWFNAILKTKNISTDNHITVKIKVLYDGDYHAFKCQLLDINTLKKLQNVISLKINHERNPVTTVYTAVIDGWYKINLSSEDIYKEVLVRIRESQRFILEIYDPNFH